MTERTDNLNRANELGLDFPCNISNKRLKAIVEEAQGLIIPDIDQGDAPPVPDVQNVDPLPAAEAAAMPEKLSSDPRIAMRRKIATKKRAAFATKVVTITNSDNRDAESTTTCHLSFENDHFGLAKNVPLGAPVQLEVALIHIAATALMPLPRG